MSTADAQLTDLTNENVSLKAGNAIDSAGTILAALLPMDGSEAHIPDGKFDPSLWKWITYPKNYNATAGQRFMVWITWSGSSPFLRFLVWDPAQLKFCFAENIEGDSVLSDSYTLVRPWSGGLTVVCQTTTGGSTQGTISVATLQALPQNGADSVFTMTAATLGSFALEATASLSNCPSSVGVCAVMPLGGPREFLPQSTSAVTPINIWYDSCAYAATTAAEGWLDPAASAGAILFSTAAPDCPAGFLNPNELGKIDFKCTTSLNCTVGCTLVSTILVTVTVTRRHSNYPLSTSTATTATYRSGIANFPAATTGFVGTFHVDCCDEPTAAHFGQVESLEVSFSCADATGLFIRNIAGVQSFCSMRSIDYSYSGNLVGHTIAIIEGLGTDQNVSVNAKRGYEAIPDASLSRQVTISQGNFNDAKLTAEIQAIVSHWPQLGLRYCYTLDEYNSPAFKAVVRDIAYKKALAYAAADFSSLLRLVPRALEAGAALGLPTGKAARVADALLGAESYQYEPLDYGFTQAAAPGRAAAPGVVRAAAPGVYNRYAEAPAPIPARARQYQTPQGLRYFADSFPAESRQSPSPSASDYPFKAETLDIHSVYPTESSEVQFFCSTPPPTILRYTRDELLALEPPQVRATEALSHNSEMHALNGNGTLDAPALVQLGEESTLHSRTVAEQGKRTLLDLPDALSFQTISSASKSHGSLLNLEAPRYGFTQFCVIDDRSAHNNHVASIIVSADRLPRDEHSAANFGPYTTVTIDDTMIHFCFNCQNGVALDWLDFYQQLVYSLRLMRKLPSFAVHVILPGNCVGASGGLALHMALWGVCSTRVVFAGGYASDESRPDLIIRSPIGSGDEKLAASGHLVGYRDCVSWINRPLAAENWWMYSQKDISSLNQCYLPIDSLAEAVYFFAKSGRYRADVLPNGTTQPAPTLNDKYTYGPPPPGVRGGTSNRLEVLTKMGTDTGAAIQYLSGLAALHGLGPGFLDHSILSAQAFYDGLYQLLVALRVPNARTVANGMAIFAPLKLLTGALFKSPPIAWNVKREPRGTIIRTFYERYPLEGEDIQYAIDYNNRNPLKLDRHGYTESKLTSRRPKANRDLIAELSPRSVASPSSGAQLAVPTSNPPPQLGSEPKSKKVGGTQNPTSRQTLQPTQGQTTPAVSLDQRLKKQRNTKTGEVRMVPVGVETPKRSAAKGGAAPSQPVTSASGAKSSADVSSAPANSQLVARSYRRRAGRTP